MSAQHSSGFYPGALLWRFCTHRVPSHRDPERHAGKSYRSTGPELLGADDMAKAIGRAVGRSVRAMPTPTWLFMKAARMAGIPIDVMSDLRYYIDDHNLGAFELGAPTSDVFDVTGSGRGL